ncbi:MAG: hypothetical protein KR126chlam1_00890 [Chlamydiae bacterium]|nr:hypothetical protein [Chlamydiota bacterium]
MKYHFKVHKDGKYYWAQSIELEGCITQATSMKVLRKNMQEALNLYVQEPEHSKDLAALPDESIRRSKTVEEIELDPQTAFSFMVRYHRIKQGMTQSQAAKKMGFDSLFSYQRLEKKSCNPSLKMIHKIKQVFPDFSIDAAIGC